MSTTFKMTGKVYQIEPLEVTGIIRKMREGEQDPGSQSKDKCGVAYYDKKEMAEPLKTSLLTMILRKYFRPRYYCVDWHGKLTLSQKCELISTHHQALELRLNYEITTARDMELDLVRELARRDTPDKRLADLLYDWVNQELEKGAKEAFDNFEGFRLQLKSKVEKAARLAGLLVKLDIEPVLPAAMEMQGSRPVPLERKEVRVQPKKHDTYLNLSIDLVLSPTELPGGFPAAGLAFRNKEEAIDKLSSWMEDYVQDSVEYVWIIDNLSGVRERLIQHWNEKLTEYRSGWKVRSLELGCDSKTKEWLDKLKSEFLKAKIDLWGGTLKLDVTFCIEKVDAPYWYKECQRRYMSYEQERESIELEVRQFYERSLTRKLKLEGLPYWDISAFTQKFDEECKKKLRERKLDIRIENVFLEKNEHNALRVMKILGLQTDDIAATAALFKKTLDELEGIKETDWRVAKDKHLILADCLKKLQGLKGHKSDQPILESVYAEYPDFILPENQELNEGSDKRTDTDNLAAGGDQGGDGTVEERPQ